MSPVRFPLRLFACSEIDEKEEGSTRGATRCRGERGRREYGTMRDQVGQSSLVREKTREGSSGPFDSLQSSQVRELRSPIPFKLLSLLWRAWQLGAQLSLHLSDEGIVGDRLARLILLNRLHVGHELLR